MPTVRSSVRICAVDLNLTLKDKLCSICDTWLKPRYVRLRDELSTLLALVHQRFQADCLPSQNLPRLLLCKDFGLVRSKSRFRQVRCVRDTLTDDVT